MKLHVENLGRIREAEIEIKPLTVFLGKNNTGKTWAASALFGILEELRWVQPFRQRDFVSDQEVEAVIEARYESLPRPKARTATTHRVHRADLFAGLTSPHVSFRIASRSLRELTGAIVAKDAKARLEVPRDRFCEGVVPEVEFAFGPLPGEFVAKYLGREARTRFDLVGQRSDLATVLQGFGRLFLGNVRYLPAERSVVALSPTTFIERGAQWPGPVRDFASMMSNAIGPREEGSLSRFLAQLEGVAGGRFEFGAPGDPPRFVASSDAAAHRFPLAGTASLVKAVFGLAAFLREAEPGDVLFIDEPEMNAHPEAQAKTAELLAMMANAGITVVVTTHSPYFVDHLTSLIEGAQLRDQDGRHKAAETLFLKDADAFISADKVAVWGFEENPADATEVRVRTLLKDDRLIDWTTFTKVSEHVMDTYGTILEIEHREAGE